MRHCIYKHLNMFTSTSYAHFGSLLLKSYSQHRSMPTKHITQTITSTYDQKHANLLSSHIVIVIQTCMFGLLEKHIHTTSLPYFVFILFYRIPNSTYACVAHNKDDILERPATLFNVR